MRVSRIKLIMHTLPVVLFLCLFSLCSFGSEDPYCGISPKGYVTGRFIPSRHSCFVNLSKESIPATRKNMYLRREAAQAVKKMLKAFHRTHPRIKVTVRSATRNFYDQRYIWGTKWKGTRKVEGKDLSKTIKDPLRRALKILEYSSMPGTSRHHWGTDIDFNQLNNAYYKKGEGKVLYTWLRTNGGRFGFGQPYTAGRSAGYKEERWHWSYLPLAKRFLKDWNRLIKPVGYKKLKINFWGKKTAWSLAPRYVNAIAGGCR